MQIDRPSEWVVPTPTQTSMEGRTATTDKAQEESVAASFEAMFVQQMLKGMREAGASGKKEFGRQTFEEMFDEHVAQAVASQGLGLGAALFANQTPVRTQEDMSSVDTKTSGAVPTLRP